MTRHVLPYDSYLVRYGVFPVLFDRAGVPRFAVWKTLRKLAPNEIVLHFTRGGTFPANAIYLSKENPRGVSIHFLVSRKGELLMLCPLNYIANHAGRWSRNRSSVGIELVHADDDSAYPYAQLATATRLCAQLCELFSISPTKIIGHRDIVTTDCPRALDLEQVRENVTALLRVGAEADHAGA